jgi:hypothetical protein
MVYKRVDSRLAFSGGFYKHVLQCPQGYKATGGGFDFNARNDDPTGEGHWSIVANFPADEGKNWVVEAHRSPKSSDKTFTAYALCAPEELLPGWSTSMTVGLLRRALPRSCGRRAKEIPESSAAASTSGATNICASSTPSAGPTLAPGGSGPKTLPHQC